MNAEKDLREAFDALRRVQLTTDDEGVEEALTSILRDLETVMSDRFDLWVES